MITEKRCSLQPASPLELPEDLQLLQRSDEDVKTAVSQKVNACEDGEVFQMIPEPQQSVSEQNGDDTTTTLNESGQQLVDNEALNHQVNPPSEVEAEGDPQTTSHVDISSTDQVHPVPHTATETDSDLVVS